MIGFWIFCGASMVYVVHFVIYFVVKHQYFADIERVIMLYYFSGILMHTLETRNYLLIIAAIVAWTLIYGNFRWSVCIECKYNRKQIGRLVRQH